ncbi:hypothetical protein ACFU9X_15445 [Streptomyces atratus]|uniref:hypothetical protein n=1 Tax=Streptomyces atratus TaxID=1893 RepID=UPI00368B0B97
MHAAQMMAEADTATAELYGSHPATGPSSARVNPGAPSRRSAQGAGQTDTLRVRHGSLTVHTLRIEIPEGAGTVHVDGTEVRVSGTTAAPGSSGFP